MSVPTLASTTTDSGHALPLADLFGPTFQGEGPSAGRVSFFVRLGGCNLSCSWCDTPYSWDATRYDLRQEIRPHAVSDITAAIADGADRVDHPLVVITGGEPLLHQRRPGFRALLDWAERARLDVEIETNATHVPDPALPGSVVYNASPKLTHSGGDLAHRVNPAALHAFAALADIGRARFKFVARAAADLEEIATLIDTHHIPARHVWIMPEGTRADAVLATARGLATDVIDRGWCLSLRGHTLLWDDERGR